MTCSHHGELKGGDTTHSHKRPERERERDFDCTGEREAGGEAEFQDLRDTCAGKPEGKEKHGGEIWRRGEREKEKAHSLDAYVG